MAYLTIIAQTFGFEDSYGYFTAAVLKASKSMLCYNINGAKFKKRRFDRVVIQKDGNVIFLPPVIKHYKNKNIYEVDQWMGAGKSVVGMEHLGRVHARGGNIMANMGVGYMTHNAGKPKEQWTPNINCMEDLTEAKNATVLIDDIKKIIQRWQCSEAALISLVANASRKEHLDIIITSQRVVNFVPKDLREVCTNYEIPYVTIRDQRVDSPDGMGMPLEIEVFNVSATGSFLGFGIWNGYYPDGKVLCPTKKMLDAYSTLEVVTDLKQGESPRINQPGYELEVKAFEFLKTSVPGMEWQHLNGKHEFDIISSTHAIDVTGVDEDGRLILEHKDLLKHMRIAKRKCQIPYLMYQAGGEWRFIKITHTINNSLDGKRVDTDKISRGVVRTVKSLTV